MYCFLAEAPKLTGFYLDVFKICLFITSFQQFDYDTHNQKLIVFFISSSARVCWASWICWAFSFLQTWKISSPSFFKDFFLCLPFLILDSSVTYTAWYCSPDYRCSVIFHLYFPIFSSLIHFGYVFKFTDLFFCCV